MRSPARGRTGVLTAVLSSAVLLTACGGGDDGDPAASSSSATVSSTAAEEDLPDLASGLLPADAFGADAAVVAISPQQLSQAAGLAAGADDLQITPKECSAAVAGTQPEFDDFDDVAAQAATIGSAATVEVLVRGGPIEDSVDQLAAAAERCPTAQITSPDIGQATVTFESLPVDDLGDGSAMLRYTTVVSAPDGTQISVPALIGAVQDGDRLLILMNLDTGAAGGAGAATPAPPQDPVAFADLLALAYEAQAEALD
ncbi:hypothetical protein [Blastococcus sp. CT_GayMR20]|uniref:hypothetical protein n=1 Tax=Blastococcus sp. CT_GayMR20 TaxID=2559609 RepID=UPI00142F90E7|nr:hypothetical protein [Blastococcus sp. CT_GayMR20]